MMINYGRIFFKDETVFEFLALWKMKNVCVPYNYVEIFCTNRYRTKLHLYQGEYYFIFFSNVIYTPQTKFQKNENYN